MSHEIAYQPITVTNDQRVNLATLANYLLTQRIDDFNMEVFRADESGKFLPIEEFNPKHTCGTAGCAVGHGPNAGIAPLPGETWHSYSCRAFGIEPTDDGYCRGSLWSWLFDEDWAETDNPPQGAARRIFVALEKGIPSNHPCQRMGEELLCYETA